MVYLLSAFLLVSGADSTDLDVKVLPKLPRDVEVQMSFSSNKKDTTALYTTLNVHKIPSRVSVESADVRKFANGWWRVTKKRGDKNERDILIGVVLPPGEDRRLTFTANGVLGVEDNIYASQYSIFAKFPGNKLDHVDNVKGVMYKAPDKVSFDLSSSMFDLRDQQIDGFSPDRPGVYVSDMNKTVVTLNEKLIAKNASTKLFNLIEIFLGMLSFMFSFSIPFFSRVRQYRRIALTVGLSLLAIAFASTYLFYSYLPLFVPTIILGLGVGIICSFAVTTLADKPLSIKDKP